MPQASRPRLSDIRRLIPENLYLDFCRPLLPLLSTFEVFRDLKPGCANALLTSVQESLFLSGDVVYQTGDAATAVYFVETGAFSAVTAVGRVPSEMEGIQPPSAVLGKQVFTSGCCFSESALLFEALQCETVVASDTASVSTLCFVSRDVVVRIMKCFPELEIRIRTARFAYLTSKVSNYDEAQLAQLFTEHDSQVAKLRAPFALGRCVTRYCVQQRGELCSSDIRAVAKAIGISLTEDDMTYLFEQVDVDGSNTLSLSEFCSVFSSGHISDSSVQLQLERCFQQRRKEALMRKAARMLSNRQLVKAVEQWRYASNEAARARNLEFRAAFDALRRTLQEKSGFCEACGIHCLVICSCGI